VQGLDGDVRVFFEGHFLEGFGDRVGLHAAVRELAADKAGGEGPTDGDSGKGATDFLIEAVQGTVRAWIAGAKGGEQDAAFHPRPRFTARRAHKRADSRTGSCRKPERCAERDIGRKTRGRSRPDVGHNALFALSDAEIVIRAVIGGRGILLRGAESEIRGVLSDKTVGPSYRDVVHEAPPLVGRMRKATLPPLLRLSIIHCARRSKSERPYTCR
jgi:hypothetical protein